MTKYLCGMCGENTMITSGFHLKYNLNFCGNECISAWVEKTEKFLRRIQKIKKTIAGIEARNKNIMWKGLKRYSRKNRMIIEKISKHDCTGLLKNGFSVLVNSDGRIIKESSELFDQKIKLIHETGDYEIRIVRV